MTLSIIIPVYNVAQYLRRCLESVTQQGVHDYEVLLVNDASYDNSLGICIEWCQTHPQFRVISHPANRGLSEARNTGILQAKGTYLAFLDSDDFLAPGTLSSLLSYLQQADVVEFPVQVDHLAKSAYTFKPQQGSISFQQWMAGDGYTHCYAWNKVYRASLWQGIQFPPGRYYEDIFTIPSVLQRAGSVLGIADGLYYYCKRNGSICNAPNLNRLRDYVQGLDYLISLPECQGHTALYIRALNAQLSYRQAGGREAVIARQPIPWRYILFSHLTPRQLLKALWFKLTYHG